MAKHNGKTTTFYTLIASCPLPPPPPPYRDNPAERLGYLRGGLKDIKTHR